jgi:hypothetical protein
MEQKILIRIAMAFIAALTIGYIQFQEPIPPTAIVALGQPQSLSNQAQIVVANTPQERANLERFDKSTFDGWNNKNWTLYRDVHAPDVLAVGFGDNTTKGIEPHAQWALEAAKSGNKILDHPIKIAAGNWTVVTGVSSENVSMVTIARWDDGRIAEEHAFIRNPS